MKKNLTLNIKDLALLKSNPQEYYKKQLEQDNKSYSHKPHLARLPHDRRSNNPDELQERIDACKREEAKLGDKIRDIDNELKGMNSTETYDPEEYDYMVDWDFATSGGYINGFTKQTTEKMDLCGEVEQDMYTFGKLDAEARGIPKDEINDYVRENWNDAFDDALAGWYHTMQERDGVWEDKWGSGYCDEEGKEKINKLIGRLEKIPLKEGSDEYEERKRTITYLKQIQSNSQEEFDESIKTGGNKNNSKVEKLEKEKESLQRKQQDYIDERKRTEEKKDKVTEKD